MNASIWAQLERWTLKVAEEHGQADTFVVSGPLWLPAKQAGEKLFEFRYEAIGTPPSLVSVPTHFWKAVIAIDKKSNQLIKFACFVIPNTEFGKKDGSTRRVLEDFLVSWSSLEAVTGLHLFPTLMKDPQLKERANELTAELIYSSGRNKPLMLTDGTKSTRGRWRGRPSRLLAHFCNNGGCR